MFRILFFFLFVSTLQAGEIHLGLLGNFPDAKPVEILAAKIAVDAANADPSRSSGLLKLIPAHDKGSPWKVPWKLPKSWPTTRR
jgi:hypothetical protein